MGPPGRQGRHPNPARLQRFEETAIPGVQKRSETNEIYIPAGPSPGGQVIELQQRRQRYATAYLIDDRALPCPKGALSV